MATTPLHSEQNVPSPTSPEAIFPNVAHFSQDRPSPGLVFEQFNTNLKQRHQPAPADVAPQHTVAPLSSLDNVTKFSRRDADLEPWRYRGYPAMCKWMASDDDFFVLRRFGELSARILLRLQDRIVKLEEDLHRIDNMCMENGSNNGTFRYDTCSERQRLLDELTSRLEHYQRFLLDHAQIRAHPAATDFQISNVKNWLANANDKAIQREEKQFIDKDGDLIPLVSKLKTPLRRYIDKFSRPRLWALFRDTAINQRLHADSGDFGLETTVYNKDAVIDSSVTVMIMILGVAMQVGPLWWLQSLSIEDDSKARVAVVTGSLVVWTAMLSILTMARSFEVLTAVAAYGIVLVVFMQMGG